ncbi:MAG: UrcA family protein [Sandarakinorhabdus sp.]|nr:UrcA family protein [Sandarakinorhabdus sp.]
MFLKSTLILVAAAALALPAVAADPVNPGHMRGDHVRQVHFSDLNLESEEGRAALNRRLDRAVKSICAVNPLLDSQAVDDAKAQCEAQTRASLDGQVDAAVRANRARAQRTAGL